MKRKRLLIGLSVVAVALFTIAQPVWSEEATQKPNSEASEAFQKGMECFNRATSRDFMNAVPFFEKAIKLDPNYGQAHAMLG